MIPIPDREALDDIQLGALRRLWTEVAAHNPFYRAKWDAAKCLPAPATLAEFTSRVPFTTKAELAEDQRLHPPYGSDLTYPLERYTRCCQTSGTSGHPIRWLDTTESWGWMVDNWVEVFRASDVGLQDRIFFAFSFGPFLGFWTAFEAGIRLGALCLPGGGMSSAARVRAILDHGATALCCTPTYALHLGEVAAAEGISLAASPVRAILAAGEPGASIPSTRVRIEALWPEARVWDHHGMTETGPVTFECPVQRGTLHVIERSFIPEVLDPATLEPVPPGGVGELVLTNLGRTGSPLVRYRTGDTVRRALGPRCDCGRWDLALEGGILGRTDDMVVVRGVNLYPGAVEEIIRRYPEVAEYRVEVRRSAAMTQTEVTVEPVPACAAPDLLAREIHGALRDAFNLRIPVECVAPGSLPRWELKARRWQVTDAE